ncbi:conserved virulence factor C family protein [Shouchella patagoniensis]|uniref:conserved virulence factor C family protein n=1 Tax=Shouchella patagoniensis TaxID=228576 RepID=UPI0009956680|nr:conserved virulence factor C family protein [Shouchella patagoniensis]
MYIRSIEPTPSPNTMKLNLSEAAEGTSTTYQEKNKEDAPAFIQQLFTIEGIKAVYHVGDFLAVDRYPKADWKVLLPQVRKLFGEEPGNEKNSNEPQEGFGEVQVQVQMFKGIPMQVKVTDGEEEVRAGLPERFVTAVSNAQLPDDNVVLERKWEEQSARYGELQTIAKDVAAELEAAYSTVRLESLVQLAKGEKAAAEAFAARFKEVTIEMLQVDDWRERYATLEQMDPKEKDLPVLEVALKDEKASIRRLATMYLGMIETESVLPLLEKALNDKSVTVRRTAGDCMSDIGSENAIPAMIESLKDESKIVRWRAAMFLYEIGTEEAIPALQEAENDPEFEVALQVKMALERIQGGEEAKGSVWKQMTEARNK